MSSILSTILAGGHGAPAAPAAGPSGTYNGGPSDPTTCVKNMITSAHKYMQEEPDQEDKLTMSKILTQLQGLLAKDQSDAESALQGNVSPRLVRKAAAGSSGGAGY